MSETLLILRRIQRDIIINVQRYSGKETLFLSYFKKFTTSREIFEKYSNIKFNENPSDWSRIVPWGETRAEPKRQMDKQADVTKLIVTFRNFANAPKIENCVLNGKEIQENRIFLP